MTERQEYTKLRDIARKRVVRIEKAGLAGRVDLPSLPRLRDLPPDKISAELKKIRAFVEAPTALGQVRREIAAREVAEYDRRRKAPNAPKAPKAPKAARAPKAPKPPEDPLKIRRLLEADVKTLTDEQKKLRRRYQNRRNKRAQRAREKVNRGEWTKQEAGLYKAAKTLGIDIPPSAIPDFAEYVKMRNSMANESAKYIIDKYTEDYDRLLKKGYTPDEILADFAQYRAEMAQAQLDAAEMKNAVSSETVDNWILRMIEIGPGEEQELPW